MNPTSNPPPRPHSFFPDWTAQLASDNLLTPGLKAGYRQTLDSFLEFAAGARPLPPSPKPEFVALTRLEKGPSPQRLQEWKDALNWFFRRAREEKVITGIPSLARDDLGRTEWEAAMINKLRQRHFAWRTEQTYRAWLWRFVHFLEPRPIQEAGGAEVRAFLSQLATELRVGPATQKQALNALVFYFREVAAKDLGEIGAFVRARKRLLLGLGGRWG